MKTRYKGLLALALASASFVSVPIIKNSSNIQTVNDETFSQEEPLKEAVEIDLFSIAASGAHPPVFDYPNRTITLTSFNNEMTVTFHMDPNQEFNESSPRNYWSHDPIQWNIPEPDDWIILRFNIYQSDEMRPNGFKFFSPDFSLRKSIDQRDISAIENQASWSGLHLAEFHDGAFDDTPALYVGKYGLSNNPDFSLESYFPKPFIQPDSYAFRNDYKLFEIPNVLFLQEHQDDPEWQDFGKGCFENCGTNGAGFFIDDIGWFLKNENTYLPIDCFKGAKIGKINGLPTDLKEIRSGAFNNTDFVGNAEINLPNGLTTIEDNVFNGAKGLAKLTIPATVNSIGNGVFDNTTSLESIDMTAFTDPVQITCGQVDTANLGPSRHIFRFANGDIARKFAEDPNWSKFSNYFANYPEEITISGDKHIDIKLDTAGTNTSYKATIDPIDTINIDLTWNIENNPYPGKIKITPNGTLEWDVLEKAETLQIAIVASSTDRTEIKSQPYQVTLRISESNSQNTVWWWWIILLVALLIITIAIAIFAITYQNRKRKQQIRK